MLSPVRARICLACGSIVLAPLMHAAFVDARFVVPAVGLGVVQAAFIAWLAVARWRSRGWAAGDRGSAPRRTGIWAAVVLAAAVVPWLVLPAGRAGIGIWSGLTHTILFLTLLMLFAGSLRPGRTPVVTAIARAARGALSPELVRYTRVVTLAWSVFAAVQLAGSALLLTFAPPALWSLFVNGLDLPLMLIMFGAEYACRRYRFGALPRLSPAQFRRALAAYGSVREP